MPILLTLSNLRLYRMSRNITRVNISDITALPHERVKALELREAEPWFDEALLIARVLCLPGIIPLLTAGDGGPGRISSGDLRASGVDIGISTEHDLAIFHSGVRIPLSLACRVAAQLGLADPADLAVTPLQRQIWSMLESSERHPEAPGFCPWCGVDRFPLEDGTVAPHAPLCLPDILYTPKELPDTITPPRAMHKGSREPGIMAYGLKEFRLKRGLMQKDMAEAIRLSTQYYARLERADYPLTPKLGRKIAEMFGVDIRVLYARPAGEEETTQ